MPQGSVGSGHQNPYNPIGEITVNGGKKLQYRKGNRLMAITRDKPPCWNAGTPVEWNDDTKATADAKVKAGNRDNGVIDGKQLSVLTRNVSEDGKSIPVLAAKTIDDNAIEYHPLIQFHNEVMARLVKDRMTRDLDNLTGPTSARRLWQYLERKYLNSAEDSDDFDKFLKGLHDGQDRDKLPQYVEED